MQRLFLAVVLAALATLVFTTVHAQQPAKQPAQLAPPAPPMGESTSPPRLRSSSDLATDEQTLRAIPVGATGANLIDFFKKRGNPNVEETTITEALKQLQASDTETQNKGIEELVKIGHASVSALRQTINSLEDADAAARARKCLTAIEGDSGNAVTLAAARVLANHNTEGAAEALIAFLPYADDKEATSRDLEDVLMHLAVREGKVDKSLTTALKDEAPVRRAFAARVICMAGTAEQRQLVLPLLKDPKPSVKFSAALGLARRQDGESIPVLIDLLAELPEAQRQTTEDFLTELAGEWNVVVPKGSDRFTTKLRREVWLAWWKATEGTALIDELKDRTLSEDDRKKAEGLIAKLVAEKPEDRDAANAALVKLGKPVAPLLRRATFDSNAKLSEAANKTLQVIGADDTNRLPVSAIRLIGLRKPEGAAEALLNYLPFAEGDDLAEEVQIALVSVALKEGKPEQVLVKALSDASKLRRIAAAQALATVPSERENVRKLFKDEDPEVRMKTALALASEGDKDAVPVLIASLTDAPGDMAWQAEEYLGFIAEAKRPDANLGGDAESRKKCRTAWETWWKTNEKTAKLVKTESGPRILNYTLIVEQYNNRTGLGRVYELDASGKLRWEVTNLNGPLDAQIIGSDRVLIPEQNVNRVTERDFKGNILWTKQVNQPFVAQRLRSGITFIANRNQLIEVDKNGKETLRIDRMNDYFYGAARLKDGNFVYVNSARQYVKLDRTGKQLVTWRLPNDPTGNAPYVSFLENGNVVYGDYGASKVRELAAADGKVLFEATVQNPYVPTKLPNGNYLVSQMNQMKYVEIDRSGKVVKETRDPNTRVWLAKRR